MTEERPLRQILTSWDRLQRLLRATIDESHYHLGWNFERVDQDERGVRVQFTGGRVEHADILVGGDGIRSSVRGQMAPEVQPIYAGYYIWRGAPNEADLAPETLRSIYPLFTFYLPERQQVIGYPIAGFNDDLTPGKRRYNFIWYRVADAAQLRDMCVDENGVQHEYSVPPPLVRKDLIAAMHKDARDILPEALLDCLMKIKQPFITPIYDFTAPSIVFGRVAMVGDAAANARPHMGFGMAKAGTDAQALAKHLGAHDDIDAALKAYNAERQPIGNTIVLHGRKLGTHLGVDLKTEEDRRMHELAAKRRRHARLDRCAEFPRCLSLRLTRSSWRPARRTPRNWRRRSAMNPTGADSTAKIVLLRSGFRPAVRVTLLQLDFLKKASGNDELLDLARSIENPEGA